MKRLLDTPSGRLILIAILVWLVLMALAVIPLATGGGPWGFLIGTVLMAFIVAMGYLVPRVSNWVEYRVWSPRTDLSNSHPLVINKTRQRVDGNPEGEHQ